MKLDQELEARLASLRAQGLLRELRRVDSAQGTRIQIRGKTLLNFSSNDYLGLANDPRLKQAAVRAIEKFGVGAGASRLVCGSLAAHHELEEALAGFKGTPAALSFSSGYATAVGTICALLGKDDVLILDKLVHACIVDAARLSGATLRIFKHNDLNDLEHILKWSAARKTHKANPNILIATESVFSMDGDCAPLRELVELKDHYGAWLLVDEAHAIGLYGERGQGLACHLGAAERIEIQMGTLGKALGVSGGYVAGSRTLVDYLVNRARSFVFSTAPPPAVAATATEAIQIVQSSEGGTRRQATWDLANLLKHAADAVGVKIASPDSLIMPLMVGDETQAVELASALRERGMYVPAIRYPTVARGAARLRITLTAAHTPDNIAELVHALAPLVHRPSQTIV